MFPVCIDLEPYKPLVNTYRYGRMATEAGQQLDFELKSLSRPTPSGLDYDWERVLTDVEWLATADKSLVLKEFGNIDGELYAAGEYRNVDTQNGMDVHGVVTADGRFWPTLQLLASNDRSKWNAVGNAPQQHGEVTQKALVPDESFPVYIDLGPYKPLVHTYRYGRLITEAGKALDFELKSLTPIAVR